MNKWLELVEDLAISGGTLHDAQIHLVSKGLTEEEANKIVRTWIEQNTVDDTIPQ